MDSFVDTGISQDDIRRYLVKCINAEFADRVRKYTNYECVASLDFKYDKANYDEDISEELNEFLSTFKIKDRGCKS